MKSTSDFQPSWVSTPVRLPARQQPMLVAVVDTEEEFDWGDDFDRKATTVEAMEQIHLGQEIFEAFRIRPTYVVDFPVASQEMGHVAIKEFLDREAAEVGAHLHPWVSPPFEEEVNRRNSFAGNLPYNLERAKLMRLVDEIKSSLGRQPVVYKAGRYGFGPNTTAILEELGFAVDLSGCPAFDFSDEGGPDYSRLSSHPYWLGSRRRLLGIPTTGAFVGLLHGEGDGLYPWATQAAPRWARLPGILSRLRLLDRLHLSPEGFAFEDLRRLTRSLLRRDVRVFTLSFHSPSLEPGRTPYVQSRTDLDRFLDVLRRYLDFFLGELEGISMTPLEVKRHIEAHYGNHSA